MSLDWQIRDSLGDAAAFHASESQAVRSATFHMVAEPTLVLGSTQRDTDADMRVANTLDIAVVKRRSGGGAVLLLPDEFVWLDLVIPAGDSLWDDDVGRAMVWVGELWQRALCGLAVATDVERLPASDAPPNVQATWARQVCFADVGRGEVVSGTRKVVGVSQRRTRAAARFQSLCHLRWRPELVSALVAAPRPLATELAGKVAVVGATAAALRDALVAQLPASR